ncbi:unnamed protein product [Kuraishia capsulata CBS 1993]|uniref:Uncharacterized protein n=1 Tax=Kuraishia capsulata CBS 1993 TaxID=1382522 RepID=W6MQL0_9ASCO|nr:uncharacterized protein KUCA_T00003525001 [Kuraishia capsulata CBS 1993]CDK27547.1 unnamed protein product [Kuraishia capsulata CBS 1993]
MSFNFQCLPRELQLGVLKKCDSTTLTRLLKTDSDTRALGLYSLNQRVAEVTGLTSCGSSQTICDSGLWSDAFTNADKEGENSTHTTRRQPSQIEQVCVEHTQNLFISVFSPQISERSAACQMYETKCLNSSAVSPVHSRDDSKGSSDMTRDIDAAQLIDLLKNMEAEIDERQTEKLSYYSTNRLNSKRDRNRNTAKENHMMSSVFQLGSLKSLRDPLSTANPNEKFEDKTQPTDNELHVLVDEDSAAVKFRFEISVKLADGQTITLLSRSERIQKQWSEDDSTHFLCSPRGEFCISFKLRKGEEVPPRSPYDYECVTNYYIDFQSFCINNCYLISCYEQALAKTKGLAAST